MKDKLITVFGGGGFVGRYVVQALLARGVRVRVAQRDPRRAWFLKPLGGLGQTQFVAADLARPETVARAAEGSDAVVNLVGVWKNFERIHINGARAVAAAADATGAAALVHISALAADPESPSAYGRSKAFGEEAVREEFAGATILRPSVIFGREDAFVNRFAAMVASAPIVPVLRPEAKFQPVYVADVADAVVNALAEPQRHGGHTYALGGPDVISMRELIRWIAKTIGREPTMVELPDALGSLVASAGFLPGAPISRDQWKMLQVDNVVPGGAAGMAELGVSPTPLATVAPGWLVQYRRHGRFGTKTPA